ncbi:hypothetical protein NEHOM01_1401 [Nematocida homosporus]|uniref:uncharacterized protein n=1 Tax=Nematocida homosporus TaxID=1912981 RepID=UPI00221E8EE3|nr:uncharacterized protein NEHOM01_1401 [Nematocida homosporus]KAI5186337.1 hypothetical protein NEHOM01_1401 [Nematocida homosporus]
MRREGKEGIKKSPNLFEKEGPETKYKDFYIPESSIYDSRPSTTQKRGPIVPSRSVTVFGYSAGNLDHVMRRFKECGEIKEINYGKNWMDIQYEREKCMFTALRENGCILNGEMIGVVQKNRKDMGAIWLTEQEVLFKREEGVLTRILAYLFG